MPLITNPSYASKSPFSTLLSKQQQHPMTAPQQPLVNPVLPPTIQPPAQPTPAPDTPPPTSPFEPPPNDPFIGFAQNTFNWEARRDPSTKQPVFYKLPEADGGGSIEFAGINDKYHPEAVQTLMRLQPEERESYATKYIADYTRQFASKLPDSIKGFGVDLAFNRGATGATKYIQTALNKLGANLKVDGQYGPLTQAAAGRVDPKLLMQTISQAQLEDEQGKASSSPKRAELLKGLTNRINNRYKTYNT